MNLDLASLNSLFVCFFVDVCLQVAYSAYVCAGWDHVEPVRCGVSCMYLGRVGGFV